MEGIVYNYEENQVIKKEVSSVSNNLNNVTNEVNNINNDLLEIREEVNENIIPKNIEQDNNILDSMEGIVYNYEINENTKESLEHLDFSVNELRNENFDIKEHLINNIQVKNAEQDEHILVSMEALTQLYELIEELQNEIAILKGGNHNE